LVRVGGVGDAVAVVGSMEGKEEDNKMVSFYVDDGDDELV
jgi:hypothetical protein